MPAHEQFPAAPAEPVDDAVAAAPDARGPYEAFLAHVADQCERAAKGDLEARVLGVPEDGDLHRIGNAINRLLDVSDAYVRETTAAMDHCYSTGRSSSAACWARTRTPRTPSTAPPAR